jgi:hypothetical protein
MERRHLSWQRGLTYNGNRTREQYSSHFYKKILPYKKSSVGNFIMVLCENKWRLIVVFKVQKLHFYKNGIVLPIPDP